MNQMDVVNINKNKKIVNINANKTNLDKILKWSTSRFNEWKKSEVINNILEAINKGKDVKKTYGTGCYSSSGSCLGWKYVFEIKNGKSVLYREPSDGVKYVFKDIKKDNFLIARKKVLRGLSKNKSDKLSKYIDLYEQAIKYRQRIGTKRDKPKKYTDIIEEIDEMEEDWLEDKLMEYIKLK